MAQFEITVDEADLPKLFSGQGLSGLVEQVLNQVLAHQVTAALKAQPGERTPERVGYQNGVRERDIETAFESERCRHESEPLLSKCQGHARESSALTCGSAINAASKPLCWHCVKW